MFGLKESQDLENWAAHRHQEFPGVPPPPSPGSSQVNKLSVEVVYLFYPNFFPSQINILSPKKTSSCPLNPFHIPLHDSYLKSNIPNYIVVYLCKLKSDFRKVVVTMYKTKNKNRQKWPPETLLPLPHHWEKVCFPLLWKVLWCSSRQSFVSV